MTGHLEKAEDRVGAIFNCKAKGKTGLGLYLTVKIK